jgi:septum formation protein
MSNSMLVLASQSKARRAMLEAAGVTVDTRPADIDESTLREGWKAKGLLANDLAAALAEAKAISLSPEIGTALVLGGDQILALQDGVMLDKPLDKAEAKAHLRLLSGKKHQLFSAAVITEQGVRIWRHVAIATLTMRHLSDDFINDYVDAEWDNIRHCVGCYEIEGRGAQLFDDIDGCQFTIMGLPLLELLDFLRTREIMAS